MRVAFVPRSTEIQPLFWRFVNNKYHPPPFFPQHTAGEGLNQTSRTSVLVLLSLMVLSCLVLSCPVLVLSVLSRLVSSCLILCHVGHVMSLSCLVPCRTGRDGTVLYRYVLASSKTPKYKKRHKNKWLFTCEFLTCLALPCLVSLVRSVWRARAHPACLLETLLLCHVMSCLMSCLSLVLSCRVLLAVRSLCTALACLLACLRCSAAVPCVWHVTQSQSKSTVIQL